MFLEEGDGFQCVPREGESRGHRHAQGDSYRLSPGRHERGKKLYAEPLKATDERVADLDEMVETMGGSSRSITTASYAASVSKTRVLSLHLSQPPPPRGTLVEALSREGANTL